MAGTRELPGSMPRMQRASWRYTQPESDMQNGDAFMKLSRWWFCPPASPMIAGTLGPVALAFSICSLGRPWVQYHPDGTNSKAIFITDPVWLITLNAIQLGVVVLSNIFLLLNMARRVRFTIAHPIIIIGWYVSAICLVSLHATAAGPLLKGLEHPINNIVWSQALYYGIWAAILYFIDASLMAIIFWSALHGHYENDFNLTRSQRTLMLQTIMFLTFLLLGALVFSKIENWDYLDGVYWPIRALLFPYALLGITSLGLVVASIQNMVVERGGPRLDARVEEKSRRKVLGTILRKGKDDMLTPLERGPTLEDVPPGEFERWAAMAISTMSWLCLWLFGAIVLFKCEKTNQSWAYFDAVYFSYISLTTIGYGDLTPKSNAGKSFFVFWFIIALPIITILISHAVDTVVRFVKNITILVGNITIPPGEEGCGHFVFKSNIGTACALEHGTTRASEMSEPGVSKVKGKATNQSYSANRASNGLVSQRKMPNSSRGYAPQATTTQHPPPPNNLDLPPTCDDLHLLLISEIQIVVRHVREAQPRRYTFEEWAWYLGLIEEDEHDPDTHCKARPEERQRSMNKRRRATSKVDQHGAQQEEGHENPAELHQQPMTSDVELLKWSWVGNSSPLLSGQEESEWILERLIDRLRELL
ncbi:potassium channel [Trichoderma compactum]